MELMIRTNHDPDVVPTWVGQFWMNITPPVRLFVAAACTAVGDWTPIATGDAGLVYNTDTGKWTYITLEGTGEDRRFVIGDET